MKKEKIKFIFELAVEILLCIICFLLTALVVFLFSVNFSSDSCAAQYNFKIYEVIDERIREVTAYNVGVEWQTDDEPCISANGEDICAAIESGESRCAANFVPFGTVLTIENIGECIVTDRLNKRYPDRVDIAMPSFQIREARKFGVKELNVRILKIIH